MFNWQRRAKHDGPAVLDEGYLERLVSHLGEQVVRELLSDGLLELTDRVAMIESHANAGEPDLLRRTVHDLSGMSGHLGLAQLASVSAQSERELRSGASALQPAVQPVIDAAPAAISALRDFLDDAGTA